MDKLNSFSYAYHYRSLDSTAFFARQALTASSLSDVRAEAYNNLAFVSIARMRYEEAGLYLDSVTAITDNQLELLIANVQQMRLCQRRSRNREFYDYRERALRSLRRINEERASLTPPQQQRLLYAESEMGIVTSTYYYYVGLSRQSIEALNEIASIAERDTAQLLNYYYNVGAGGIITTGQQEEINQQEFDYLMRCLFLARQYNYPYFEANALEALAEHLLNPVYREQLLEDNLYALKFINTDDVPLDALPAQLAEEALCIFKAYGDVYQIAGAYRTLAACSREEGNYPSAMYYLEQALADTLIYQAPDLVASIREQLSVAYAAIDNKALSDQNRNVYLDLQEQTRQDRWLEARAVQLSDTVSRLNILLLAIGVAVLLLIAQMVYSYLRYRRRYYNQPGDQKDEQTNDLNEQLAVCKLHIEDGERRFLEQRAKISLANSITPFIDRILYEVNREPIDAEYVSELTDKINEQNDLLTQWIQLRQGQLSLHIESFALQPLFDLVARGRKSFQMKGVEFDIMPTTLAVKADRVLTLFMLNTLADNARKFTPEGGQVTIAAEDGGNYVELSVADTGTGMSAEQVEHVFDRKPIKNSTLSSRHSSAQSHGFGLLNCRGIIEKYRKTSTLFSVCDIKAESEQGRGSRFFFRLPKAVVKTLLLLFFFTGSLHAQNQELSKASAYADSAYYSNINGNYARSVLFADMCRQALNEYYMKTHVAASDTLLFLGDISITPPEVLWLKDSVQLNYDILLTMRNETAIAALALHQWDLYTYNNRIYTQLFKELSADSRLEDYCRRMQQLQTNYTISIVLLVIIFVVILIAVVFQMLQVMHHKAQCQQAHEDSLELLRDELHRLQQEEARLHVGNQVIDNCLSALKHETMYYPSRIRQLIAAGDTTDLPEVVGYYRELYGLLGQQAMTQLERHNLHLKPLDHELLGDENLIRYMFDLLRKQSGQKEALQVDYQPKDEKYVVCRVKMPGLHLSEKQASQLFVPIGGTEGKRNIPFLLCRQIVRDHGEAAGRRACGIWAEVTEGQVMITIILPRQICKISK